MRSEQKFLNQFVDSFVRPSDNWNENEAERGTVPRLPRIANKQLVSVRTAGIGSGGQIVPASMNKSDRMASMHTNLSQLLSSYVVKKNLRPPSVDGHCYYKNQFKKY